MLHAAWLLADLALCSRQALVAVLVAALMAVPGCSGSPTHALAGHAWHFGLTSLVVHPSELQLLQLPFKHVSMWPDTALLVHSPRALAQAGATGRQWGAKVCLIKKV